NQIYCGRLQAELANHPDDLAAVERRVVDDVLHLFDERKCEWLAFDALVAQILPQSFLGQIFEQLPSPGFDLSPPRTQRRDAGEIVSRPDERMRHAFPSFEPYPFGPCHVNERSVDRAVTDLEVVSPLLFGQILSRVEREAVGVVGVIEESAYVVEIHSFSLENQFVVPPLGGSVERRSIP